MKLLKTCFPLVKLRVPTNSESFDGATEANFLGCFKVLEMLKKKSPINQCKLQLDFNPTTKRIQTSKYLPIYNNNPKTFIWNEYIQHLTTKILGRTVIHCNIVGSTFDLLDGQFMKSGMAVIADQQISGRGRSSNKWLSPEGKFVN